MFITDRLVYVELQKTGCTHIGKLLAAVLPGRQIGKHNKPDAALLARRPIFVGSVRNPWAWYVSLWAYGCQQEGMLHQALTHRRGSPRGLGWRAEPTYALRRWWHSFAQQSRRWSELYRDAQNVDAFRTWLHWLHDWPRRWDCGEHFARHACCRSVGLMTYRYLDFFCSGNFRRIADLEGLKRFNQAHNYIDHMIRTEQLEQDLLAVLAAEQVPVSAEQRLQILGGGRSNASRGKRTTWQEYYDPACIALVAQRDQLIIERYGYQPPLL